MSSTPRATPGEGATTPTEERIRATFAKYDRVLLPDEMAAVKELLALIPPAVPAPAVEAEGGQKPTKGTQVPPCPDCGHGLRYFGRTCVGCGREFEIDGEIPTAASSGGADATTDAPWVVWSNYHDAWWGPNQSGYTTSLLAAGVYTEAEARRIEQCRSREPGKAPPEIAQPLATALDGERRQRSGKKVVDLWLSTLSAQGDAAGPTSCEWCCKTPCENPAECQYSPGLTLVISALAEAGFDDAGEWGAEAFDAKECADLIAAALRTAVADAERERDALAGLFGGMARELGLTAPHDEPANVYESVEALTAAVADAEGRAQAEFERGVGFGVCAMRHHLPPTTMPCDECGRVAAAELRAYAAHPNRRSDEIAAGNARLAPSSATPSTETGTGQQHQQDQEKTANGQLESRATRDATVCEP